MKETIEAKAVKPVEPKFKKQELLKGERYRERVDLLRALLKDGQEYSLADVEKALTSFMKGKVR